ncbi:MULTISPECIES: helix-turn-helix domain-containing protein [unclassified Enterococcus]|uniref:helix-turn-helix domain-containing protein n=1 Tax=unclassified Enterococcus TaxID=2608891 RepID=UPI0013EC0C11|nr:MULTISPECIES: helix-turn-helix domain-containing protein [unclassified Enterococcus]
MRDYYSVNELAKQLGVTTRSIRNYLHEGKLKGTKVGGQWKFSEQDLYEFLYGSQEKPMSRSENLFMLKAPIVMKFNLYCEKNEVLNQFRDDVINYHLDVYANQRDRLLQYNLLREEHAELLIGGNFRYITNFSAWINEQLMKQTDISLSDK